MDEIINLKSGEFLVKDIDSKNIFIPEEFNEEQLMIAETCQSFIDTEIYPILDQLDKGDRELMKSVLKKSGELGLMGISIPEEYGGFGQSFVTQMLAADIIGCAYSFSVAFTCHTGIGTLPIMYYGNEYQRNHYVTRLAAGELIGAYCLTEPGAGSDANSGKTSAVLSEDGKHYIINGQKMWITNGGFCDTQVVFAKIDNDRILSAFIVESTMPGIVIGSDEHKMGIKGSSTTQIYYNDVKVPVENLLGSRGEGFRIALSILHMGRMKLGANVIGASKAAINQTINYANERKQFGNLISSFGAIKFKFAEMVILTFAQESATYRVSNDVDVLMAAYKLENLDQGRATIEAISHFAVEDAILKVYGSEVLAYVVDEGVQIHGGMGFSAEMKIERAYRDSRINRIFEGTNEINRLLIVESTIKNSKKGLYDLTKEAEDIYTNLNNILNEPVSLDYFTEKQKVVKNFKRTAILLIDSVSKAFKTIVNEQEIQNNLADIISEVYISESLLLRVKKLEALKDVSSFQIYKDILDVYLNDAASKICKFSFDAIGSHIEGESAGKLLEIIQSLTKLPLLNVKAARRRIADKLIEDNKYKF